MKKKKLKKKLETCLAVKEYVLLENKKIYKELERLRGKSETKTIFIVTKQENILFGEADQRTIYYLPRKVNDDVDFAVFFDYNDACKYIASEKLEKSFIMKSQIN